MAIGDILRPSQQSILIEKQFHEAEAFARLGDTKNYDLVAGGIQLNKQNARRLVAFAAELLGDYELVIWYQMHINDLSDKERQMQKITALRRQADRFSQSVDQYEQGRVESLRSLANTWEKDLYSSNMSKQKG